MQGPDLNYRVRRMVVDYLLLTLICEVPAAISVAGQLQ